MLNPLVAPEHRKSSNASSAARHLVGTALIGKEVQTSYGGGYVTDCRPVDRTEEEEDGHGDVPGAGSTASDAHTAESFVYTIQLVAQELGQHPLALLYTREVPIPCSTPQEEEARRLNVAYESLERMRRMNLEMEFYFAHGIIMNSSTETPTTTPAAIDKLHHRCTTCLFETDKYSNHNKSSDSSALDRNRFPRLQKLVDHARDTAESAKSSFVTSAVIDSATATTSRIATATTSRIATATKPSFSRLRKLVDKTRDVLGPSTDMTASSTTTSTNASTASSSNTPSSIFPPSFPRLQLTSSWGLTGASSTAKMNMDSTATSAVVPPTTTTSTAPPGKVESDAGASHETVEVEMENGQPGAASTTTPNDTLPSVDTVAANLAVEPSKNRKPAAEGPSTTTSTTTSSDTTTTPSKRIVLPRIQKLLDDREKGSTNPCLICGNPVCAKHRSATFKKEGITLCLGCERLFELDFLIECVSTRDPTERAKLIDHMVDCYDRCLLILKYSTQYVEPIALSLEQQKEQQNKIGLGSSSAGVLSGALGIAAAATILTPAGPPLLIASLFFGGSATVVQTGTEAYNYFSEPNKLADRIIALHGMLLSILRVTSTLRDAMMRNHIRTDVFEAEKASLAEAVQEKLEKNKRGVLVATNMGRAATLGSVAGAEAGVVASATGGMVAAETAAGAGAQGATALTRAGAAAARTVRFARFAGGALSAAVLVMEANAIHSTLKEIHNGSPCEKANRIRAIAEEIKNKDLPTTSELDEECQAYLKVLANRPIQIPEVAAIRATNGSGDLNEFPEAECAMVELSPSQEHEGVLIVGGETAGSPAAALAIPMASTASESPSALSYFSGARSSLFQSITLGQARNPRREPPPGGLSHEPFADAVPVSNDHGRDRRQSNNWSLLL
jgi:hypothetical protein